MEVQRSQPPTFSFAATAVGSTSTDSPQSVTVQGIGNQSVDNVSPGLTVGSNSFEQVEGSGTPADCTSQFSLNPGATCNLSISFIPQTTGSIVSAATFTDNALNAAVASQSVTLQGTGTRATQAPAFTSAASTTFTVGTAGSFTVTATGLPAPTLSESGALPSGVTFNATTGVLSGTATAAGTYNITFTASNGVGSNAVQNFSLKVIALQSIAVAPSHPSLAKGLTLQFTATGTYSDASARDITASVTWTSSKPAVATITAAGLATAASQGPTTISATSGAISGSTVLTVTTPALTSISITPVDPTIVIGGTRQFVATGKYSDGSTKTLTVSVTWASSNTSVATIVSGGSTPGLASGGGVGTSTISATLGSISGTTTLTVQPALVSIMITPVNPSLKVGATLQFTATGHYSDSSTQNLTSSVTWTSSKPGVATISTSGLATAVAKGNTGIKAKLGGITSSTTLTVTP